MKRLNQGMSLSFKPNQLVNFDLLVAVPTKIDDKQMLYFYLMPRDQLGL
jgi:hypothetical protein